VSDCQLVTGHSPYACVMLMIIPFTAFQAQDIALLWKFLNYDIPAHDKCQTKEIKSPK